MSGRIFLLGDTHFLHKKIWPSRGFDSMEEHDRAVALSIFQACGRDDSLYLLGDICFGGAKGFHRVMMDAWREHRRALGGPIPAEVDRPNFSINVVQGNHDGSKMLHELIDMGWITNYHSLREFRLANGKKVVATHVPIHPSCLDRWAINAHAHTHARMVFDMYSRFKCVSWEMFRQPIWIDNLARDIL